MVMTDSIFVKTILGVFEMREEFEVMFYRFPCVLSVDFTDDMDRDVRWEETTRESWYDYCSTYLMMSV